MSSTHQLSLAGSFKTQNYFVNQHSCLYQYTLDRMILSRIYRGPFEGLSRVYQGPIEGLSRLSRVYLVYQGSIEGLSRLSRVYWGSIEGLSRVYREFIENLFKCTEGGEEYSQAPSRLSNLQVSKCLKIKR